MAMKALVLGTTRRGLACGVVRPLRVGSCRWMSSGGGDDEKKGDEAGAAEMKKPKDSVSELLLTDKDEAPRQRTLSSILRSREYQRDIQQQQQGQQHEKAPSSSSSNLSLEKKPPPEFVLGRFDLGRRKPVEVLKNTKSGDDWLTPDVVADFEQKVMLKDVQLDPEDHPDDHWEYLTRRRRTGARIDADEYDFLSHAADREPRPEVLEKLGEGVKRPPMRPACNAKRKYHILPRNLISPANLPILKDFLTEQGTIVHRRHTQLCGGCQRRISKAIKRARHLGFIPWTTGWYSVNLLGFPDEDHLSRVSKTI
mmetsp:Transcript_26063/g.84377  ORF Transcript_26063/g.84377 Transcript_26063/m.84377 type:complete len:311 (-) Transcript_26063:130-1062(-)